MISVLQLRNPSIIYTIAITVLFSPLLAGQGSAEDDVPLVRFACQQCHYCYHNNIEKDDYSDFVLLIDQLSTDSFEKDQLDVFAPDIIDGRILSDPDRIDYTKIVPTRLRIYRASLVSETKTREEIIEELDSRPASADTLLKRPKDYFGFVARNFSELYFSFTGYPLDDPNQTNTLVKEFDLNLNYRTGRLITYRTGLGAILFRENGLYVCESMFYRPAAPEVIESLLGLTRETRRLIQAALAAEGYDPGPLDGIFGKKTRNAITEYQKRRRDKDKRVAGYLVDPLLVDSLIEAGKGVSR